jgi:hypothetical protein
MSHDRMRLSGRLALALAGAGLSVVGTVLLMQALWGALALALGPLWASAMVGALLALTGALCLVFARPPRPHTAEPASTQQAELIATFLEGIRAGRSVRRGRGRR